MRKKIAELENQIKTLEQTVSLQNKKFDRDVRKLKEEHKNQMAQFLTHNNYSQQDQSRNNTISSVENTTTDNILTQEYKVSSKEDLSISGN